MRDLVPVIEEALGPDRLSRLKSNPDEYQNFWVGVLEAFTRVDWDRDVVAYLISSGYGAVRNGRRSEWSEQRMRWCPKCGKVWSYRTTVCPRCGCETESGVRHSEYVDLVEARQEEQDVAPEDVAAFLLTLSGAEAYVARRWMRDRADLTCQNHLKQIAWELGVSAPRVAQIKSKVRQKFAAWINGAPSAGH